MIFLQFVRLLIEFRMENPDLDALRVEVDGIINEMNQLDTKVDERNQKRIELIEELKDLLPEEEFQHIEQIMKKTIEAVRPAKLPLSLPPIYIDEENPLESLRKVRCEIAKEVCDIMGGGETSKIDESL